MLSTAKNDTKSLNLANYFLEFVSWCGSGLLERFHGARFMALKMVFICFFEGIVSGDNFKSEWLLKRQHLLCLLILV